MAPLHFHSDRQLLGRLALLFWSFAVAVWLYLLAPAMAPVRRGTAADFWEAACGIELEPPVAHTRGDVFVDPKGWFVYDRHHLHGSNAYFIPANEANVRLHDTIRELEMLRDEARDSPPVRGYLEWLGTPAGRPKDAAALVRHVQEARCRQVTEERPDLLPLLASDREMLALRWGRMRTFWATLTFEWLLFAGLAAVALRPWVRQLSPVGWGMHFGVLFPAFMLPAYLGYSTLTFTSAGPTGGVLYPWVHVYTTAGRGSVSETDRWILERLPPVLEAISAPIGSPPALTGRGMPGPTQAIATGLVVSLLAGTGRRKVLRRAVRRMTFGPLLTPRRPRT